MNHLRTAPILPSAFVRASATGCVLLLSIAQGCVIVPVRLPAEVRDISGKDQKLDFAFLKAGSTSREEVIKKLGSIDAGINRPEFFWGRWRASKWGYGGLVAVQAPAPLPVGGRAWGTHNLLIAFDYNGTVKTWIEIDDRKLLQQLDPLDNSSMEPLDLSSPVHAKVLLPRNIPEEKNNPTGELVLSADFLECSHLKVSRVKIRSITTTSEQTAGRVPGYVWLNLHILPRRRFESPYTMAVDPPTLLLLRRYINQSQSGAGTQGSPTDRIESLIVLNSRIGTLRRHHQKLLNGRRKTC